MLDGSVFKKLLKAKNAGEWLTMLERINNEHLMVKNFHSFDRMEKKVDDFLIMLEDSLPDEKFEQQQMVQNFREIFNYKFKNKLSKLVDETVSRAADILYVTNQYPEKLLYFYPEAVMDKLLCSHLQKMIPLNKDHVQNLTKVNCLKINMNHNRSL